LKQKEKLTPKVLDEIVSSVNRINYGEVVITIHDSKIVQIERREKKRFDFKPAIQMKVKT